MDRSHNRCKECEKINLRSQVNATNIVNHNRSQHTFIDEMLREHRHDPSFVEYTYRCNNGHSWTDIKTNKCWCGWAPEEDEIGTGTAAILKMLTSIELTVNGVKEIVAKLEDRISVIEEANEPTPVATKDNSGS